MGLPKSDAYRVFFEAIRENTMFCAACGKPYDMQATLHHHFPFCEDCRYGIIKKSFGTEERKFGEPRKKKVKKSET